MPGRQWTHSNRSVNVEHFSMIPQPHVPRSAFKAEFTHKTTFDAGYLIPIYVDEVLPGDSHKVRMTAFCRMSTPVYPVMDNLHLDSFFFFVPCRLLWTNWKKFMGEQYNPGDSTNFVIPSLLTSPGPTWVTNSIFDYFGLPVGVKFDGTTSINVLPFRAYNLIYNEWFRDQNLQPKVGPPPPNDVGDGPDSYVYYNLLPRGKRHDYFTSCLPWPIKSFNNTGQFTEPTMPLGGTAPIRGLGFKTGAGTAAAGTANVYETLTTRVYPFEVNASALTVEATALGSVGTANPPKIYADLSQATGFTINALRQAFQIQRLLERDARGGTRYTELVRAHFGVTSPDARLQRPEYLGGGTTMVNINPVAQTAPFQGNSQQVQTQSSMGTLGALGTAMAQHGFSQSFTEHGYIIGLVNVRADLTYQQGLSRLWTRQTRYDFYWPAFAQLGEQAVLRREIYCDATGPGGNDGLVFGYQERWAEYRHKPSRITGSFRQTTGAQLGLNLWHLAEYFSTPPTLSATFIQSSAQAQVQRVVAAGSNAAGQQFLCDALFEVRMVRPMPAYSVPGLIDHF